MALVFGVAGIVAGGEALHYTQVGASGDDFTGLLAIPAGLGLLMLGTTTLIAATVRAAADEISARLGAQPAAA